MVATRIELPQVPLCTGCGRCCRHIGMPPFEVSNPDLGLQPSLPTPGGWISEQQLNDMDIFAAMPPTLRAEHAAMLVALDKDPTDQPCAWLDTETGACRHYEWRPSECREFVPDSAECNALRATDARCVWHSNNDGVNLWWNPRARDMASTGHTSEDSSPSE